MKMLWNWYTIDACFLTSSWHIRSSGAFAGSCIGVILLVIALEFLRRFGKEYDRSLLRGAQKGRPSSIAPTPRSESSDIGVKGASSSVQPQPTCAPMAANFRPTVRVSYESISMPFSDCR